MPTPNKVKSVRDKSPGGRADAAPPVAADATAGDDEDVVELDAAVAPGAVSQSWRLLVYVAFVVSIGVLHNAHGHAVMFVTAVCFVNYGLFSYLLDDDKRHKTFPASMLMGLGVSCIVVLTFLASETVTADCSKCWGPGTVSEKSTKNFVRRCAKLKYHAKKYWGKTSNIFYSMVTDKTAEPTWPLCFDDFDDAWKPCVINTEYVKQQLSCQTN